MPRASRLFMDYGCYHIITRGNQKQIIFVDEGDFERYLAILKKAKRKYNILLYAYCLMPNHIHLLIEVNKAADMSNFMHWVNRGYTAYYNTKHEKVGHLWQGRFKSKPIVKGLYLIHCSNYIEANPIRANIIGDIGAYRWSSYKERCLLANNSMVDDIIIDRFSEDPGTGLILKKGTG